MKFFFCCYLDARRMECKFRGWSSINFSCKKKHFCFCWVVPFEHVSFFCFFFFVGKFLKLGGVESAASFRLPPSPSAIYPLITGTAKARVMEKIWKISIGSPYRRTANLVRFAAEIKIPFSGLHDDQSRHSE